METKTVQFPRRSMFEQAKTEVAFMNAYFSWKMAKDSINELNKLFQQRHIETELFYSSLKLQNKLVLRHEATMRNTGNEAIEAHEYIHPHIWDWVADKTGDVSIESQMIETLDSLDRYD